MCLVGDESALTRVDVGTGSVEEGRSYEFRDALVRAYPGRWHSVSLLEDGSPEYSARRPAEKAG